MCGSEAHGRPISLDDPVGTHFSVAHTDGLVLLAIADVPIGVDAEPLARRNVAANLESTLHGDELEVLSTLDAGDRSAAMLACWVRTEACLKVWGTGLGREPSTVAAMPSGSQHVVDTAGDVWLADVDPGPAYVAALAAATDAPFAPPRVSDLTLTG